MCNILDSPNNTELDEEKRLLLFNYLFHNIDPNTQLIISTLGFAKEDYPDTTFSQIVELENNKYSLLNTKDYQENVELLIKLTSTTV